MAKVMNIVVIKDGVINENDCLLAEDNGVISVGMYAGKDLYDTIDRLFYDKCREINPSLPEWKEVDWDSIVDRSEDFPSFEDGFYETDNGIVCSSEAHIL